MKLLRSRSASTTGLLGLLILSAPAPALALRTGQDFACVNCHEGQDKPEVEATMSASRVEPGESITITVTTTHAAALVGGVLVDSNDMGVFEIIDEMETHLFNDVPTQVTHAVPKPFADGQVEFSFNWIAPAAVGPVEFEVWANAANDNLDPHDDSAQGTIVGIGVGCDALWYYTDEDADGLGDDRTGIFSCDPMTGLVNDGGDCDDKNPEVNASVVEICNDIDDNCDGEIDEDFERKLWVADADGDGYGSPSGESKISCQQPDGFAPSFDDCDDDSPDVHPGATEVANGMDDNCNGIADESTEPVDGTAGAPVAPTGTSMPTDEGTGGAPATPPDVGGTAGVEPAPSSTAEAGSPVDVPVSPEPTVMESDSDAGTTCAVQPRPSWSAASAWTLLGGLVLLARRRRA